ncbi:hypothetical protein BD626DRAFT_629563 [Schizophyllum amplum]|uniref:Uncharacterized protein n=1 Tax=Schizophyllum amplum TaxID=97359 RepID=A0A550CG71_9AGAR|nr:hypothetical protein BD626DRAFT_629563 [Auriculariopsis ampla]
MRRSVQGGHLALCVCCTWDGTPLRGCPRRRSCRLTASSLCVTPLPCPPCGRQHRSSTHRTGHSRCCRRLGERGKGVGHNDNAVFKRQNFLLRTSQAISPAAAQARRCPSTSQRRQDTISRSSIALKFAYVPRHPLTPMFSPCRPRPEPLTHTPVVTPPPLPSPRLRPHPRRRTIPDRKTPSAQPISVQAEGVFGEVTRAEGGEVEGFAGVQGSRRTARSAAAHDEEGTFLRIYAPSISRPRALTSTTSPPGLATSPTASHFAPVPSPDAPVPSRRARALTNTSAPHVLAFRPRALSRRARALSRRARALTNTTSPPGLTNTTSPPGLTNTTSPSGGRPRHLADGLTISPTTSHFAFVPSP